MNIATGCFAIAGTCLSSGGGSSFAYPFPSNATSTLLALNGGLTSYASSTIGNGTAGLTVSGNSTTTGQAYFAGRVGIGTTSPQAALSIGASSGTGALAFPDGTTQNSAGIMIVQDQKASGTAGGSSVAGQNIRTLNTVVANTIPGASLASSQVTLPAGSYEISGCAPYWIGNKGKAYWFNVTDNATTTHGTSMYGDANTASDPGMTTSCVNGYFTIAAQKTFELRQYIQVARATNGLGVFAGQGTEVYSTVTIHKW
jgi:hypothetical protein